MNQEQTNYWEQQKNGRWKALTNSLKNDPEVHAKINNLITTFYWKFRENKGIAKDFHPQVIFKGFEGFKDFPTENKMGHCEQKITKYWEEELNGNKIEGSEFYKGTIFIVLNQKLLLDKLGMDKWFSSERTYLLVGFEDLIGTIAHELAHAYQYIANLEKPGEPSQCESTGKRDSQGNLLYPELAAEHTRFTSEIKNLIENSAEYQEFKKWWTTGKQETQLPTNNSNDKRKKLDTVFRHCHECRKDIENDKRYYNFDGNKYCESCGKAKQQEIGSRKCLGCGIELEKLGENHHEISCVQTNTELKQKKPFDENIEKGEYQVIGSKQKDSSSASASLLLFGGIVLTVVLAGLFFWLEKRKSKKKTNH